MTTKNRKVIRLDAVESTNDYLGGYVQDEAQADGLTVVVADYQSAGRGSGTNKWESERGRNLLFSVLVRPSSLHAGQVYSISEVSALALLRTLAEYSDGFSIKWPNDIYWRDGKIAGMLIENDLSGKFVSRSVVGIGLNVNQTEFLSDAPNPVSLAQILGRDTDRDRVLDTFLSHLESLLAMMEAGEYATIHSLYMERLYRRVGMFGYEDADGAFEAEIEDVEPSGRLVLRLADGTRRRYDFKEVKFRI